MCERYIQLVQHCYFLTSKIRTWPAALLSIFFANTFFVQECVRQTLMVTRRQATKSPAMARCRLLTAPCDRAASLLVANRTNPDPTGRTATLAFIPRPLAPN